MTKNIFLIVILGVLLIVTGFTLWNGFNSIEDNVTANESVQTIEPSETIYEPAEIVFSSNKGKQFHVLITSLPPFETYLKDAMDFQVEMERVQIEDLDWNQHDKNYFLLKYGCGIKSCDLLLVEISNANEVKTLPLPEGIYTGGELEVDKAALRIAVNEGNQVIRHQLILVNLLTMEKFYPQEPTLVQLYFESPLYPITEFNWETDQKLVLTVANIADTEYETIEKWTKEENPPVEKVEISLQ